MSDVQLVWPNKDLSLRASGGAGYEWVQLTDRRLLKPLKFEQLTARPLNSRSNVLAIGDGLDVLDALTTQTTVLNGGIRLVYIDPPFNTQVNFRQYNDTMQRPMQEVGQVHLLRVHLIAWRVATSAASVSTSRSPSALQLSGSVDHERRARDFFTLRQFRLPQDRGGHHRLSRSLCARAHEQGVRSSFVASKAVAEGDLVLQS